MICSVEPLENEQSFCSLVEVEIHRQINNNKVVWGQLGIGLDDDDDDELNDTERTCC